MQIPSLSVAAVVVAALALSACVSDGPEVAAGSETEKMTAEPGSIMEIGSVLQELDARVDKYVFWRSQPGEDAARERYLERTAAATLVRLHESQLIATAADAADPTRRTIAAKSLAFSTDDAAVAVLIDCLSDRADARLLTNATFALGEMKNRSTPAMPLIDLLSHPDPDVRNNTLLALFQVMESRRRAGASPLDPVERVAAMPLIETALFDLNDPLVRGHAAACLGSLGDPRSVDALVNLLPDPDPFVRTRTALALGKLGDVKAVPALVAVIDDTPRGNPRDAVITALRVLVERSGRTVPRIDDTTREWRRFLLARPAGPDPEKVEIPR